MEKNCHLEENTRHFLVLETDGNSFKQIVSYVDSEILTTVVMKSYLLGYSVA
jgi:hypothetical protein